MSRTLLFSVEDTPGTSIEVFVSGNDYGKHIPGIIEKLKQKYEEQRWISVNVKIPPIKHVTLSCVITPDGKLDKKYHPSVDTNQSSELNPRPDFYLLEPGVYLHDDPESFVPSATYLEDRDCIDFILEDEMRVSSPAFADKENGHYIDISKSLDDRIIGLTLWVDVLNEYICLKDVGNTCECVQSYTFIKKGKEYALSVWLKDKSIVGFRMVIMQKDIVDEVT